MFTINSEASSAIIFEWEAYKSYIWGRIIASALYKNKNKKIKPLERWIETTIHLRNINFVLITNPLNI